MTSDIVYFISVVKSSAHTINNVDRPSDCKEDKRDLAQSICMYVCVYDVYMYVLCM